MTKHSPFRYFKTSSEIIRLAVMMYVRFPLSLRNVEDLLNERGIDISYETVRFWWNGFGSLFAAEICKKRVGQMRAYSNWQWHLDEVFVKISGETHYLWRAVDHEGEVLEGVVAKRQDRMAALKFLWKTMKGHDCPHIFVTGPLDTGWRNVHFAITRAGTLILAKQKTLTGIQFVVQYINLRGEMPKLPSPCIDVCKFTREGHCIGCSMKKAQKSLFKTLKKDAHRRGFVEMLTAQQERLGRYTHWEIAYRKKLAKKKIAAETVL